MNRETEIKLELATDDDLTLLDTLEVVRARHFEDNLLFDRQGELSQKNHILRLRRAGDNWYLTFKGQATIDAAGIKSRDEFEFAVGDGETCSKLLRAMGYEVWFQYQKYRTTYRAEGVLVMLDETPIGRFIELEGDTAGITRLRTQLKLDRHDAVRESYIGLYRQRRGAEDSPYMVF